jgi:hypothetical protein
LLINRKSPEYSDRELAVVEKTVFEGRFIYRFNRAGRIVEHSIDNILPAPKQFVPLTAISWWQRGKLDFELNSTPR